MSLPTELRQSTEAFLQYLDIEKNASPNTIKTYKQKLGAMVEWLEEHDIFDVRDITSDSIRRFRIYLSRSRTKSNELRARSTQRYYIIVLRSWLRWLIRNDIDVLYPEKLELPKCAAPERSYLTVDQMRTLLAQPMISKVTGVRNRAILEVFFSTGMRVSELINLNRDQIDFTHKEIRIIGKGGVHRVVFLSKTAIRWIKMWLRKRKDSWKPLFIRFDCEPSDENDGEKMRMTHSRIYHFVQKYAKQAYIVNPISPHSLRHSFATNLLNNGASLREIQIMLGHKSIMTTQIYTHVTKPKLREAHEKYHSIVNVV